MATRTFLLRVNPLQQFHILPCHMERLGSQQDKRCHIRRPEEHFRRTRQATLFEYAQAFLLILKTDKMRIINKQLLQ